jgi:hypothetical protein
MKHVPLPRWIVVAFLLTCVVGRAQLPSVNFPSAASAPGTDFATMSRLLGSHSGFTARYEVRMYDKSQKETISAAMNCAYLENKMRLEINLAQMKNKDLPAGFADQLKQMGMDQIVTLIRPDKQSIYVVYPKLEACLTQPLPKETEGNRAVEKQALGKETLDGEPCVKNRVTFTSNKGGKEELTVWNATNLKDFPVQVLTKQDDDTIITRYRQIQLAKPEARLFDLPAGFKEYEDTQSFVQGIMPKVLSGGLPDSQ